MHKVTFPSGVIKNVMKKLSYINSKRAIMPILENTKLTVTKNKATFEGSDMQTIVSFTTECESKATFSMLINVPEITLLCKEIPEMPLEFSYDPETRAMKISSQLGKWKYQCDNVDDYSVIPSYDESQSTKIHRSLIDKLFIAKSFVDPNPLNVNFVGVCMHIIRDKIVIVGSDVQTLFKSEPLLLDISLDMDLKLVLPIKSIDNLSDFEFNTPEITLDLIKEKQGQSTPNMLRIQSGDNAVFIRLMEGNYVDYNIAFRNNNDKTLKVKAGEVTKAVRLVDITSNQVSKAINFKIGNGEITLNSENPDYSKSSESKVEIIEMDCEKITFAFNSKNLLRILNKLTGDIKILIATYKDGFYFTDDTCMDIYLCMPCIPSVPE